MKRKIVAYAYEFQEMDLSKDIFLIPYYVAKELSGRCIFYYLKDCGVNKLASEFRSASFVHVKGKYQCLALAKILLDSKNIDVFFLKGSSAIHMLAAFIYKRLNPSGQIVTFADMEANQAMELNKNSFVYSRGVVGFLKKTITNFFFHHSITLIANTEAFKIMQKLFDKKHWKGLLNFYPCIDDERFMQYGLKRIPFENKEKIMLCVGRIGCYQKNTEMLLNAIKQVDLKEWRIYMIGPITNSFNLNEKSEFSMVVADFFKENPQYKKNVIFTGMIYDQKQIMEYYIKAKVLLSTSRHEGFANVYSQAAALGCFIVSTDVGGADVCSNNWNYGVKLCQEDSAGLAKVIYDIVNDNLKIDETKSLTFEEISYSTRIKKILLPLISVN